MIFFLICICISDIQYDTTNLAQYYLKHLDLVDTPEKRNDAIMKCLTEIALIIDKETSKKTLKSEFENKFNPLMSLIDSKDRDMKHKFKNLQIQAKDLENEIQNALNNTDVELQKSLKEIRQEIIKSFNEIVHYSQTVNNNNVNEIVNNIDESLVDQQKSSLLHAIFSFILLQIILVLALFFANRYIKNLLI